MLDFSTVQSFKFDVITLCPLLAEMYAGRRRLGLPICWSIVAGWLCNSRSIPVSPLLPVVNAERKFTKIPVLSDYRSVPDDSFWNYFPKRALPAGIHTNVRVDALTSFVIGLKHLMSVSEYKRGMKVLKDLRFGADAYQKSVLPPATIPNARSAFKHGVMLTDKIAGWVDTGFMAGPFECPPMPGFRANSIMAVERNGAVRPVINMSAPYGASFNDNLDTDQMEKVWMSTARSFSYTIRENGKGCVMSKYDLKDAYKNVPAKVEDWKYQGVKWLGRYFFETQMIFGASPSVANFDRLGNTIVALSVAKSGIPRQNVHRTLDDIPVVAPKNSDFTQKFGMALKEICEKSGIKIADNCPKNEKAFEHVTRGTVLGIGFDTEKLEWFVSEQKAGKLIRKVNQAMSMDYVDLGFMQSMMGLINDLSMMCPFLKFYRFSGNKLLGEFKSNKEILLRVPERLKSDLAVCARIASSAVNGMPIVPRPAMAPLFALQCYSDAAGAKYGMSNGKRVHLSEENDRGVACMVIAGEEVQLYTMLTWPMEFLNEAKDAKGHYYGSKTTTLEAIGVLLPFLSFPEKLRGATLVFHVDNIAVVYGWANGAVKFDESASIILRAVHLASSYLGVKVYIQHIPRCSNSWASMADRLSRKSTTTSADRWELRNARRAVASGSIVQWMKHPREDWDLPNVVLAEIVQKIKL
jgi:hypothetical protein